MRRNYCTPQYSPKALRPSHKKMITFKQRANDRLALPKWMNELMSARDSLSSSSPSESSAIAFLVAQRKRHAIGFAELRRQISVYSEQLGSLLGQLWEGEEIIVGRLMASCQKIKSESESYETSKKVLVDDFKRQMREIGNAVDEANGELAVALASLRDRGSEIDGLKHTNAHLEAQVASLRQLLGRYVEGHAPDEPATLERQLHAEKMRLLTETSASNSPYTAEEIERLARQRQQTLFEMNDDIDVILNEIEKEGHRQAHVLRDIETWVRCVDPAGTSLFPAPRGAADAACQCDILDAPEARTHGDDLPAEPPRRPARRGIEGRHVPLLLRAQMASFPRTRRIPSLRATLRLILDLHLAKIDFDKRCDAAGRTRLSLGAFPYCYFWRKFGRRELADEHAMQLVRAVEHHRTHKRVRLFGEWLGVDDKDRPPVFAVRDSTFVLSFFVQLQVANEFTATAIDQRGEIVEISRKKATEAARVLFADKVPDEGASVFSRVQALPAASNNQLCVDLDDVVELVHATWCDANELWRAHATFLFQRHKALFRVKEEMRFADDAGRQDVDVLLVRMDHVKNFRLREARSNEITLDNDDDDDHHHHHHTRPELVALLTADAFGRLMRQANPYVQGGEIARVFERGCDMMRSRIQRDFLDLWHRYRLDDNGGEPVPYEYVPAHRHHPPPSDRRRKTPSSASSNDESGEDDDDDDLPPVLAPMKFSREPRVFWHSPDLDRTQWTPPFDPTNFQVNEIDAPVFIDLCLDEMILAKGPFSSVLNKAPSDLWPNSEAYLAQIEDTFT